MKIFNLPDLGEGLHEAEIVEWLVKEGEKVTEHQPMVAMETAKAVVEVPCPYAGVISKLHGKAGDIMKVGKPLVTFDQESSTTTSAPQAPAPADSGTVVGQVKVGEQITKDTTVRLASNVIITPLIRALAHKLKVNLESITPTGPNKTILPDDVQRAANSKITAPQIAISESKELRASPAVRALARRLGVGLSDCQASGKKGTITREDVERCQTQTPATPILTATQQETLRSNRRSMAQAMMQAHAEVVLVPLMDDADISEWPEKEDITVRVIRALVAGCRAEPALNAWFDGKTLSRTLHPHVDIGIAVDTSDGLFVPVLRHAEMLSAAELRGGINKLREGLKNRALPPAAMQGATISLSNFGTMAGRYAAPIVVPPQVAILGTGRLRYELKLTDRGVENRRLLPLSLSFDHRPCTGGEAARFLAAVIKDLELAM